MAQTHPQRELRHAVRPRCRRRDQEPRHSPRHDRCAQRRDRLINSYQMVHPTAPYGGVKFSGHGRNLGAASIEELTQLQSIWTKIGA